MFYCAEDWKLSLFAVAVETAAAIDGARRADKWTFGGGLSVDAPESFAIKPRVCKRERESRWRLQWIGARVGIWELGHGDMLLAGGQALGARDESTALTGVGVHGFDKGSMGP